MVLLLLGGMVGCTSESNESSGGSSSIPAATIPDSMTIPRMLDSDNRFSTLRAALDSTGLDSLLATDGPFTLLAPPNEAFNALPPGTMDVLLSEETGRLRTILTQHIVEGRVSIKDGSAPDRIISMTGDTLSLGSPQKGVRVGEAAVLDANIEASNGLLHVIDQVLLPPEPGDSP